MSGNQLDITVTDYAEYLAEGTEIKTLLLYIEGFKRGEGARMLKAVAKLKQEGRRAVFYLAGRTQAGQKAVMGHTASIAGDYVTAKALLGGAGALMAESFEDFIALSELACRVQKPKNNKVFMISNAGFEGSGMADSIDAASPIIPQAPQKELASEFKDILTRYNLDGLVDVRNPFDITPMCPDDAQLEIITSALKSGQYGAVLFATVPLSPAIKTLEQEKPDLLQKAAAAAAQYKTPLIISVSAGGRFEYYRDSARKEGLCVFENADYAVKILAQYLKTF
jgi:acetyltransferase